MRGLESNRKTMEITGSLPYRKPLVLRYSADTAELWAAGVGPYKLR